MTDKMIVACPECRTRFVAPLEKFLPSGRKVRCAKCGHAWFQRLGEEPAATAEASAAAETTPEPAEPDPAAEAAAEDTSDASEAAGQPAEETTPDPEPERQRSTIAESVERTEAARTAAAATAGGVAAVGASYAASAASSTSDRPTMPSGTVPPEPAPKRSGWRTLFYLLAALIILGALAYFYRAQLSERFPALAAPLASYAERVDRVVDTVVPGRNPLRIENVTYDFEDIEGGRAMLLSADVVNAGAEAADSPKLAVKILGENDAVLHEAMMAPEDMTSSIEPDQRSAYFLRIPHPPEDIARVEVDFARK